MLCAFLFCDFHIIFPLLYFSFHIIAGRFFRFLVDRLKIKQLGIETTSL